MKRTRSLVVFCLLSLSFSSFPNDLGVYGHIYPIQEEDFLVFIHKRLEQLKANGQLAKMKTDFINRAKHDALNPSPVDLSTTENPKTYFFDPTFVLKRNIRDGAGHILFKKGTRVNPLSRFDFDETWLFFDARDPRQLRWAKSELKTLKGQGIDIASTRPKAKVILTGGNLKKAINALHVRIYFDQLGKISQKLGIQHVPAVVTGHGLKLKIQEAKVS